MILLNQSMQLWDTGFATETRRHREEEVKKGISIELSGFSSVAAAPL
jgi:hypothetical protein